MKRLIPSLAFCITVASATAGAQTRAGMINVGDASINYEITGAGKTVVFIHGWANTLAIWDNQIPIFSQRFQVVRYDRRGWGKSTGFADISADPDDLRILLDSLGIASAYVVGLSAGSEVATRFAVAFPNRTGALVRLSGPPPQGLNISAAGQSLGNFGEIARKYGLDSLGKFVHATLVWQPPGQSEAEARRRFEWFQKAWAEYSGRDLLDPHPQSGRVPPARWDRIHTLSVPTLIVNGDHDQPLPLIVADSLARRLPNARKVVITGAGHGAHLYNPDQFSKALLDFFAGIGTSRALPGEGYVAAPGGKLWYRVVGTGPRTPLLLVHGCCGVGSYYLKPLEALANERPVIFYDQIDNGRSDHPGDTTLWRMQHFADEIASIREALGLKEIHLYGHSFGANVVTDYMLTHPAGVKSLTLAGAQLDMTRAAADMEAAFKSMPDSVQSAVLNNEKAGTMDSPQYMGAVFQFLQKFHARRLPWSAGIDSSVAKINWPMGNYLYGPGLLGLTGPMKSVNPSARLGTIRVPTLITIGEYDYTSPASARHYQRRIRGSRLVIVPNSGHLMMHDDEQGHMRLMREFLVSADR